MNGLCECGCAGQTRLARQTDRKLGWTKGQPIRFIRGHQVRTRPPLSGYKKIGLRLEHVLIAERVLGRPLRNAEEVHHVDEHTLNNATNNLVLCQDRAYHMFLHARLRVKKAGGNPNTEKLCNRCHRALPFDAFHKLQSNASSRRHAFCKTCSAADRKTRNAS